jgi:hypothetical protein
MKKTFGNPLKNKVQGLGPWRGSGRRPAFLS